MMLINGQATDLIKATERAVQFGDGVFETMAVVAGRMLCLQAHLDRLHAGCRRLGIADVDLPAVEAEARQVAGQQQDGILKVIISRGQSTGGYPIPAEIRHTRMIASRPWPDSPTSTTITACLCQMPAGRNPVLAGIKHLNRLEQVLARREVEAQRCDEGIVLDVTGDVIEGTASNVFLLHDKTLITPDLTYTGVAGIVRVEVLRLAEQLGLDTEVRQVKENELQQVTAMFFTNSLRGVQAVRAYAGRTLRLPPLIDTIRSRLRQAQVIPA